MANQYEFMGRPLRGLEKDKKQKPQEFAFPDGTCRRANDATAAMVMRPASEDEKYQTESAQKNTETFTECPEIGWRPHNQKNWKGRKFGRLTVIGYGYYRKTTGKASANKSYWIMRCVCGRYEYRSQVALKRISKSNNHGDIMCGICLKVERMRRSTK